MAVEPDSAGVRFPPPFVYLGALLLGLAAERFVTLRSFGIDWRLLVETGALLFIAGAAMMLAAAGLFRRLGTNVRPSQPTTLIATIGPYRWTRNPMYLGMALIYAGLAIGFDAPIAFALLPLVLIAIQTRVIAYARAVVLGSPSIPGRRTWRNMKELVATSSDVWEPSTKPTLVP